MIDRAYSTIQNMEAVIRVKLEGFFPAAFWLLTRSICLLCPFILWEYSLLWTSDNDFSKIVLQGDTKPIHLHSNHTVVVYTGPTQLDRKEGKNELYLRNFEYFLTHKGVDCENHDTIITLSNETYNYYMQKDSILQQLSGTCGNALRVVRRQDTCYDMGSLYMVLNSFDINQYEYFVYLNCGVVGPLWWNSDTTSWTLFFTSLLNDRVKMSGLSANCYYAGYDCAHVQSMAFAVDNIGLDIIQTSGAVYDCQKNNTAMTQTEKRELIGRYEVGMSQAILRSEYSIATWFTTSGTFNHPEPVIFSSSKGRCRDPWYVGVYLRRSWGCPLKSPSCNLTFFKTSRFIPSDIIQEVGYQMVNAEMDEMRTMYEKELASRILALQSLHSAFLE
eukprot:scaffold10477_cov92-Cylindrotheca_fusiformis.AAC.1